MLFTTARIIIKKSTPNKKYYTYTYKEKCYLYSNVKPCEGGKLEIAFGENHTHIYTRDCLHIIKRDKITRVQPMT